MNRRLVKIEKDGHEAEVMPQAVARYEKNGWTAVEDGSSEEAPVEPQEVPFDASAWSPSDPTDKNEE